jgi:hypothetical protein
MEQRIKGGEVVPPFRLPAAQGGMVERGQYRGKASLAIVFVPDLGAETQRFMQALDQAAAGWARDERPLLVARASLEELAPLASGLSVPLLADVAGTIRARYLPDEAAGGWFTTDRYGELYGQGLVQSAAELPEPAELRRWLEFIGCQCGG